MREDHSAEIIALLTRIAAALERAYPAVAAPLPVGPRVFPAWTPKDFLSHLPHSPPTHVFGA